MSASNARVVAMTALLASLACHGQRAASPPPQTSKRVYLYPDPQSAPCNDPSCQPLYVIDGVPLDSAHVREFDTGSDSTKRFKLLAPSEIDSIKVMRGPEAIRSYGEEARNGVVFVWTKRRKAAAADSTKPRPQPPP